MDAVGVVTDLVVVRVSKTNAAYDSFEDSGVEEKERKDDNRCERMVVFPDPLSPLDMGLACNAMVFKACTYRNTIA